MFVFVFFFFSLFLLIFFSFHFRCLAVLCSFVWHDWFECFHPILSLHLFCLFCVFQMFRVFLCFQVFMRILFSGFFRSYSFNGNQKCQSYFENLNIVHRNLLTLLKISPHKTSQISHRSLLVYPHLFSFLILEILWKSC